MRALCGQEWVSVWVSVNSLGASLCSTEYSFKKLLHFKGMIRPQNMIHYFLTLMLLFFKWNAIIKLLNLNFKMNWNYGRALCALLLLLLLLLCRVFHVVVWKRSENSSVFILFNGMKFLLFFSNWIMKSEPLHGTLFFFLYYYSC